MASARSQPGFVRSPRPARVWIMAALLAALAGAQELHAETDSIARRHWFEMRTLHFHTYSCGPTQEVAKLAARLEQFQEAYSVLAGPQAVASPPIVVMAFPEHAAMRPFLPLYQGEPANLAAFFCHGSDENLIVMYLSEAGAGSLDLIFHEYAHLLLRHNELFWPMWLKEGMAEIYSTFEVTGSHSARIGHSIPHHVRLLKGTPLMPLQDLFAVTRDSPGYNERDRQGIFYAESWLLTHYLMVGAPPARRACFGQLTTLLRQGQAPATAFAHAFQTSLPVMQEDLRRHLEVGKFDSLQLAISADLRAPRAMATRGLTPVETYFRLGDELLRIGRLAKAEACFEQAQKLAPASPLPCEGLGLLAAEREHHEEAARLLREALDRGSQSYLAHYTYAREKYRLTAHDHDRYAPVKVDLAAELRAGLRKALALMPDFGPAHHLLGFLEMAQGEDLVAAEAHLRRAVELEPENEGYLFSLAEAQMARKDSSGARHTLESLRLPYIEADLRAHAERLLKELDRGQ